MEGGTGQGFVRLSAVSCGAITVVEIRVFNVKIKGFAPRRANSTTAVFSAQGIYRVASFLRGGGSQRNELRHSRRRERGGASSVAAETKARDRFQSVPWGEPPPFFVAENRAFPRNVKCGERFPLFLFLFIRCQAEVGELPWVMYSEGA